MAGRKSMQTNTSPFPLPPCFKYCIPSWRPIRAPSLSLPPLPLFPPLMSNRCRKRVFALLRAPSGSAFQKCDDCGLSVAVALLDMHEGECKGRAKRIREVLDCNRVCEKLGDSVQPRSPFQFFMEKYRKICKIKDEVELDRAGFEHWKNMTNKERQPYEEQARVVDSAHEELLMKEINCFSEVDDEADSAMVGRFDLSHCDIDYTSNSHSGSSSGEQGFANLDSWQCSSTLWGSVPH